MLLSRIKNAVVTAGPRDRTIQSGAFKGLRMQLDLQRHAQSYLGLYERELHPAIERSSAGVRSALDVGAADGSYALYFLARTEAARIFAFEPDPAARAVLGYNLMLNGFAGSDRLTVLPATAGSSGNAVPLDQLLDRLEPPTVVKLDVEGAEVDVLRGAAALLARGGVRWLIETHAEPLERECLAILRDYGYAAEVITPAWWRAVVPEDRPIAHNQWIVAADRPSTEPR